MKATKEVDKGMPTVLPPMLEAFIRASSMPEASIVPLLMYSLRSAREPFCA